MDTRTRPATVEEVAEGVHAFVQLPGGWCVNNAGIVIDGSDSLVVDTAATEARTRALRAAVNLLGPAEPGVIVNTHHHSDHTFGNALFGPATQIVSHETTREQIIDNGLNLQQLWPDVPWGEVGVRPPTITFEDRLTLRVGGLVLELITVGPAHTATDVVVWIPARRVLFAGDVIMSSVTPFTLMGSVDGSLHALELLRRLGPEVVVAGHGPVAGPEVIEANLAYFRWLRELAEAGQRDGLSTVEAARRADLGRFAGWLDSERLVANLRRCYAELDGLAPGAPLDILAAFGELAEFHGGVPVSHA